MNPNRLMSAAVFSSLLVPSWVLAHPGHGHADGDFSLVHYLTEPQHVLLIAGIFAGGLLLTHFTRRLYRSMRSPKPLTGKPAEAKVRR